MIEILIIFLSAITTGGYILNRWLTLRYEYKPQNDQIKDLTDRLKNELQNAENVNAERFKRLEKTVSNLQFKRVAGKENE